MSQIIDIGLEEHVPDSQRLVEAISLEIRNKRIRPGQRLPSIRELAAQTKLPNHSVRQAINILRDKGVVKASPRSGIYVADDHRLESQLGLAPSGECVLGRVAVVSAFLKNEFGVNILHPRTVSGIYKKSREVGAHCDLIEPDIDLASLAEIRSKLSGGGYDGVVWLYPEVISLPVLEQLSKEFRIVITSHSRIGSNLASVENDEAGSAMLTANHFLERGCCKAVAFCDPATYSPHSVFQRCGGGHGGYFDTLRNSFVAHGLSAQDDLRFIELDYGPFDRYRRVLLSELRTAEAGNGVILGNTPRFRRLLEESVDEVVDLLARQVLVINTSDSDRKEFCRLVDDLGIAEQLDFQFLTVHYEMVGQIAVQKLYHVARGDAETSTTLVDVAFESFHDIYQPDVTGAKEPA